jgi:UDPglucose 6-dehydrogenase
VLGGVDERSISVQEELYGAFRDVPVIRTNPRTAEMIKYTSNALLATLISFSNEIGNLGVALGGIDVADVMRGVHASRYLTSYADGQRGAIAPIASFLWAGCGFGGSCLPKDVSALAAQGRSVGQPMPILESVLEVNRAQPERMIELIRRRHPSLRGLRVTVLGLAFRPDTSDMRESPAIPIVRTLVAEGAEVVAYDPQAIDEARRILADLPIRYAGSMAEAVAGAEAVLLVTRWTEFRDLPAILRERNPDALVVDGRRILDPGDVGAYEGIGR